MRRSRNPARRRLSTALNRETPLVLLLGVLAWLAPDTVSLVAGWTLVAVLILTPLGRIGWLASRWTRFDRAFAVRGWALLGTIAATTVIAVLVS